MTVEELPGGENIELSAPVELVRRSPSRRRDRERPDRRTTNPRQDSTATSQTSTPVRGRRARRWNFDGDAAASIASAIAAEPVVDLDSTDEHPILVLDERDELPEDEISVVESIVLETVKPLAVAAPPPPTLPIPKRPRQLSCAAGAADTASAASAASAAEAVRRAGRTAPRILIPDEMRKRLAEEAAVARCGGRGFEPDEPSGLAVAALALGRRRRGARVPPRCCRWSTASATRSCSSPVFGPGARGRLCVPRAVDARAHGPFGLRAAPVGRGQRPERGESPHAARQHREPRDLRPAVPAAAATLAGPLRRDTRPARHRAGGLPAGRRRAGLLGPGERADALIRIVDPGPEAVGFELDVCLPATGGVRCAARSRPQRP